MTKEKLLEKYRAVIKDFPADDRAWMINNICHDLASRTRMASILLAAEDHNQCPCTVAIFHGNLAPSAVAGWWMTLRTSLEKSSSTCMGVLREYEKARRSGETIHEIVSRMLRVMRLAKPIQTDLMINRPDNECFAAMIEGHSEDDLPPSLHQLFTEIFGETNQGQSRRGVGDQPGTRRPDGTGPRDDRVVSESSDPFHSAGQDLSGGKTDPAGPTVPPATQGVSDQASGNAARVDAGTGESSENEERTQSQSDWCDSEGPL